MPRRCCVPKCKSNYDSTLKTDPTHVAAFQFPISDESMCQKWIEAIGLKNWTPTKTKYVCRHHFSEDDIISTKTLYLKEVPLKALRCKKTAVPKYIPGITDPKPPIISIPPIMEIPSSTEPIPVEQIYSNPHMMSIKTESIVASNTLPLMVTETSGKICRVCLCTTSELDIFDMFNEKGNKLDISGVISQHFWFIVRFFDFELSNFS